MLEPFQSNELFNTWVNSMPKKPSFALIWPTQKKTHLKKSLEYNDFYENKLFMSNPLFLAKYTCDTITAFKGKCYAQYTL